MLQSFKRKFTEAFAPAAPEDPSLSSSLSQPSSVSLSPPPSVSLDPLDRSCDRFPDRSLSPTSSVSQKKPKPSIGISSIDTTDSTISGIDTSITTDTTPGITTHTGPDPALVPSTHATMATPASFDEPLVYRDLREWLEEQERNPKPLSQSLQKALMDFKRAIEPELGDRDWVSLLNLYIQANDGAAPTFTEHPADDNRWTCTCQFVLPATGQELSFPNAESGLSSPPPSSPSNTNTTNTNTANEDDGGASISGAGAGANAAADTGTTPSFSRKKDAKKYAARACVEWLIRGGYMTADGVSTTTISGKAKAKAARAQSQGQSQSQSQPVTPKKSATGGAGGANKTPKANGTANGNGNTEDYDEDHIPPATKRVEDFCKLMGLTIPQYRITPSPTTSSSTSSSSTSPSPSGLATARDFFDGRADFGPDAGLKIPEGLGDVKNVYGRKNAKERVAEVVLGWLVGEQERRMREVEEMMGE
ncbi:hypothetical protein B0J18DRAFT_429836 [Chaetomium sp. MPI-SDFR-AT-0129]|nr:hypothetical protein B0J18DRAFT_429836 [Chaetomium sp. MPI-SDFR-AT-0129]